VTHNPGFKVTGYLKVEYLADGATVFNYTMHRRGGGPRALNTHISETAKDNPINMVLYTHYIEQVWRR